MAAIGALFVSSISVQLVVVLSNLQLQLFNALRHSEDFLLERGLVRLQVGQLLLQALAFSSHVAVVTGDLLEYTVQLVGERLPRVLALHGQHGLERLLLRAQNLNFFLVNVKIFGQLTCRFIQVAELALEVRRIVALVHAHNGQTSRLEAIALLLERDYNRIWCG